jgi:hypothetical protein
MMARRSVLGLALGGVSALLGGCGQFGGTSYRYRMTVEVDTPQGLKTGSAVHEISASEELIKLPDSASVSLGFRGEAFPVELGDGKTLFVLISSSSPSEESLIPAVQSALDPDYVPGGMGNLATAKKMARLFGGGQGELKPRNRAGRPFYPLMVRFRDERDPRTVEEVPPEAFETLFGPGYRLKRITVETTGDPVTEGIIERLPWLVKRPKGAYSGPFRSEKTRPTEYLDGLGFSDLKREK